MDEVITYVFIDEHGTEMTEEYETPEVARRIHAEESWEPAIGPIRLVRKTYLFTGAYEPIEGS